MRIHVMDLIEGDRLDSDTFNGYGLNVLSKGKVLYGNEISKLLQHQIDYVSIEERTPHTSADLTVEQSYSPQWLNNMKPVYNAAIRNCELLFEKAHAEGSINIADAESAFQPLIENFNAERDIVSILLHLGTKDDYTYQHSVQVGMLSYYLAQWLGYDEQECARIGKAGFLHDIGKCKIDSAILNKPGKLTNEEFEEIKQHTVYGHDIILRSYNDEELALTALQHHERVDGSGYPNQLRGDAIHPYAKIVAVADIYSAMITERVYQTERDLFDVLKELNRMSFGQLDPLTTHVFIRQMLPNFIGKKVLLKSGRTGEIVMTHPSDYFRPLIQLEDRFMDLSIEIDDEIKQVIGSSLQANPQ
ncbi:HD-GYP domain-containing protein [Paenibacillaceae bacterium]|nr:HD-GYP domain-containing protein [Paenibacillaceae bacterium]